MRRLAVGVMSVAVGLVSLNDLLAQTQSKTANPSPNWSWLTKNSSTTSPAAPPKPSSDHAPSSATGTSVAAESVPTFVLRQTTCNIPFTVDPAKSSPTELQLYVSQDRGANWKYQAKAAPTERHFTFRAITDGEYWFALRSVEKGATTPNPRNQNYKPGLKVIFDTREPELQFTARLTDSGEVSATWKISDTTLKGDSLKIEYQVDPTTPWRTVILPPSRQNPDGSLAGNYSWIPDKSAESVIVRAEVSDRADNKTVVSRRLLSPQVATNQSGDEFHPRSQSMVTHPVAHEGQSWPADNQLRVQKPKQPAEPPSTELPPPKPSANPGPSASTPKAPSHPLVASKPPIDVSRHAPAANEHPAEEEISAYISTTPPEALSPAMQTPDDVNQAPSDSPTEAQSTQPPLGSEVLGQGERPRMTRTRQFSLDYEIDPLGPTSLAKVQLWGTADGGRTWKHWQDDADQASPIDLVVDQDGIYGFRIVIVSSNQLSSAPPQPGDPADIWVGVDTSKPTARLTSAIYGEGEHVGQLDIRWQAVDVWFTDRPITLAFSENPQGPWSTIAAGLPNSGQYYWTVDPRIPRHIYLRIEARDEAGNLAEHQISDPISTAGLIPHGRIRGLRPNTTTPLDDRSAQSGATKRG